VARGIGEGIARAFAAEGAIVRVTDMDADGAEAVAASVGGDARAVRLDVREEVDGAAASQKLNAGGGLDILANTAGITGFEESAGRTIPSMRASPIGANSTHCLFVRSLG